MFNQILTALLAVLLVSGCKSNSEAAMNLAMEARRYLEAGQIGPARVSISKAIAKRDDIIALYLLKGRIEVAGTSPNGAFSAYNDALALDGSNMEALQGVAQFGLQIGRVREAKSAAQKILVLNPGDPNALIAMGLIQIIEKKTADAKVTADKLIAKPETFEGGVILKGRALFMEGKIDEALALLNQPAITAKEPTEGIALTLIELYREKSEAPALLNQFAVMRRFRRNDAGLLLDEANLSYKVGQASDARKRAYQAALGPAILPKQISQMIGLLREYDRTPFTDAELTALSKIGTKPLRLELARFYLDTGQPDKVPLVLGGWTSTDSLGLLARMHVVAGRVEEGGALAETVLKEDSSQCDALIARSQSALSKGNSSQAVLDSQLASNECPQYVSAWLALADAFSKKSDAIGVKRAFDQGIDNNPQDTVIAAAFAAWLESQKKGFNAVNAARRLTRDAPALLSGWRLLNDVATRNADTSTAAEATQGLGRAQKIYGIDLLPGEKPPIGLFGRLRRS